jgi:hypothetical protein
MRCYQTDLRAALTSFLLSTARSPACPNLSSRVVSVLIVALVAVSFGVGTSAGAEPKARRAEKAPKAAALQGIDTDHVWRGETEVFTAEQLVRLEPILRDSICKNEKVGCLYLENGRPGSEASYAFRVIPWKVSRYPSYLVRNDRCGAGGCDEGLFVQIDGRWRLVTETFGVLERASSMTLGFNALRFHPRGQPPLRLVWNGRTYREAPPVDD